MRAAVPDTKRQVKDELKTGAPAQRARLQRCNCARSLAGLLCCHRLSAACICLAGPRLPGRAPELLLTITKCKAEGKPVDAGPLMASMITHELLISA
eukprot:6042846-Prymnesium_polylepis.1